MKITKNQLKRIIREERSRLLKEHAFNPARRNVAPMPLKSLASPEFAAAIKGYPLNEVTSADSAEELKEEISVIRDTVQEIRDFTERGNMDFSLDGQTRVAALMEQVLDIMEESITVLNEEAASEEF